MGKNNNIIEINGTRYDARSGEILSRGHHAPAAHQAKSAHAQLKSAVKKPTMSDVVRHPAKHGGRHTPTSSHTLMRTAVKKPAPATRKHSLAQGHTDTLAKKQVSQITAKKSAYRLDHHRLHKAKTIPKSQLISHFSDITSDSNQFAEIYTAPQPTLSPQPLPKATSHHAKRPAGKPKTTAELLDYALSQANSHEEKPPKGVKRKRSRRSASLAAASVVGLLLFGYVGAQQLPNMRLQVASAKAGFSVGMPEYKPVGYSLAKISYSPGVAATSFKSNSDQRSYTITQKTSAWNSQALRDNFVFYQDDRYHVTESGGRSIYLYGKGNATWVNGGIWYVVASDGSLTDEQLVDLATTL